MANQKCVCTILLAVTYILCFAALCSNVAVTLKDYFSNETIETFSEKTFEDFFLPDIAVCSTQFFTDPQKPMLTIDNYKSNSKDPGIFISAFSVNRKGLEWIEEDLFTHTYGRCKVFHIKSKVLT